MREREEECWAELLSQNYGCQTEGDGGGWEVGLNCYYGLANNQVSMSKLGDDKIWEKMDLVEEIRVWGLKGCTYHLNSHAATSTSYDLEEDPRNR